MQYSFKGKAKRAARGVFRSKKAIVLLAAVFGAAVVAAVGLADAWTTTVQNDSNAHLRIVYTYAGGFDSGWHFHPGVVIVVVESGTVTTHDASCQTVAYGAHQSFVESGTEPFMVSNESKTETAVDVATQVAPAGGPFRIEDDPPPCA